MPGRNRWQVCFSNEEDEQVRAILRQYHLKASELLRMCFTYTVERTPDLRRMSLQIEREALEKRLEANLDELEPLTKGTPPAEVPPLELPNRRPRVTGKSAGASPKTDRELFNHYNNNLGCGGKLGELSVRKLTALLQVHSDWKKDVPEEKRHLLVEEGGDPR